MIKFPRSMLWCVIAALLLACSNDTTTPNDNNGNGGGNPPPPVEGQATASAQEVTDFATGLYAAQTAAEASQALRDFFVKFGLPVYSAPPADISAAPAQTSAGPFVLDAQIDRVAEALVDGVLIDLDSYFNALYPWNVRVTGSGRVTREWMSGRFIYYGIFDKLEEGGSFTTEDDLIPATIVALGQARSAQTWFDKSGQTEDRWKAAWSDSVWGDNFLDPVQFLFLTKAFFLSSAADSLGLITTSGAQKSHGGPYRTGSQIGIAGKLAKSFFEGELAKDLEIPLSPGDAVKATLCSSLLLFGYTFDIQVDNKELDRPAVDPTVDPATTEITGPEVAAITATLVYKPLPENPIESFCEEPGLFPSMNKPVFFEDVGNMIYDGNLDIVPSHTDDFGVATATYRASPQVVPPYLRTVTTQTTGWIWVKARGLVPGWSNLEMGVDFLRNPTQSAAQLYITHYGPAVGVRIGDNIIGEGTGGDPLRNSLLFCETAQLGGTPANASRTFTDEGSNYTVSFTLVPPGSPAATDVRFLMSIDNQSTAVPHGISIANDIAIDVVNPMPDPRRRLRATWTESSMLGGLGNWISIGCRGRQFAILDDNSGSGVADEQIAGHDYVVAVPRITRSLDGPDSWTGEISITLEEEAP